MGTKNRDERIAVTDVQRACVFDPGVPETHNEKVATANKPSDGAEI